MLVWWLVISMRLIFLGQLGLPRLSEREESSCERRVELLARSFSERGHEVIIIGTKPFLRRGTAHGVRFVRRPSLDPRHPGGWVFVFLSAWFTWRQRADLVHVHGWRAAVAMRLLGWSMPATTLVWTADTMPAAWVPEWLVWWLGRGFMAVTVPSRVLQYRLLYTYQLRTTYIPDGIEEPVLSSVPLTPWGLKKGQYVLVLGSTPTALARVVRAYSLAGLRKKLVVMAEGQGRYTRLAKRYPFLTFVGFQRGRVRQSLVQGAAATIVADTGVSPLVLLQAMWYRQALAVVAVPAYQEIVGVAGHFWRAGDTKGLASLLRRLLRDQRERVLVARQAARRVRRHFVWERLLPEYLSLYAGEEQTGVLLDSVRSVATTSVQSR